MKIAIVTTPIRPKPTNFPPFGSMAIIMSLRKILAKEDVKFYRKNFVSNSTSKVIICKNFKKLIVKKWKLNAQ